MFLERGDFHTLVYFCRGMLCLPLSVQHRPRGRLRSRLSHKIKEIQCSSRGATFALWCISAAGCFVCPEVSNTGHAAELGEDFHRKLKKSNVP
jgi:hypothetical protein